MWHWATGKRGRNDARALAWWRRGAGDLEGPGRRNQEVWQVGADWWGARCWGIAEIDPAAMAAAVAEAAPFRPQAAAPRLLPIRRGHGNPATASVPRGPLPRPRHQRGRPPAPRFCTVPLRKCPRFAPSLGPVSGCRAGSSSLPSFLCHSARAAAAAAAAQTCIRPGRGQLCVRSAVCAAA